MGTLFDINFLLVVLLGICLAESGNVSKTETAPAGQFTANVAVLNASNEEHLCSGMLADSRHVVTSAACVINAKPDNLFIQCGSGNMDQTADVKRIVCHPDYIKGNFDYNIAVLKLKESFNQTTHVHPAVLPKDKPQDGSLCFAAGWIQPKKKAQKNATMVYSQVRVMKIELCQKCAENVLCAGNNEHEGDCINDSGSPLICNGVVYGIYVGSVKDCQTKSGIYSDVEFYTSWITRIIQWDGKGTNPLPHPSTRKMQFTGYTKSIRSGTTTSTHVKYWIPSLVLYFIYHIRNYLISYCCITHAKFKFTFFTN